MNALALLELGIQLTEHLLRINALLQQMEREGRKDLTPEELASFQVENDAARAQLAARIDAARQSSSEQ